jgi:hypothetical protein
MRAGGTPEASAALVWPLLLLVAAVPAGAQEPSPSPVAAEEALPLAGAAAQPLAAKGETRVSVPKDAPRLEFDTGPSAYALFRLPDYTQPYTITVQSFCQCMGLDKRLFIPLAAVLDEGFRVTRRTSEHDVARRYPKLSFGDAYPRLEARLAFADEDRAERYLVVYTDGDRVGETFDIAAGPEAGGRAGRVGLRASIDFKLKRSADAALKVQVSPARR